jgi:hypothetical protein
LKYADEIGFHFAGFTYLQEVSTFRAPIGFRGKGFPGFGDALFLRKLSDLPRMAQSPDEHGLMLRKLAFIAINFGHVEYGLHALSEAERITPSPDGATRMAQRKYAAFLDEAMRCYRAAEPLYPRFIGVPEGSMPVVERKRRASLAKENAAPIGNPPPAPAPPPAVERAPSPAQSASGTSGLRAVYARIVERSQSDSRRIRQLALHDTRTAIAKAIVYTARGVADRLGLRGWLRAQVTAPPTPPATAPPARQWPFEQLLAAYGFAGALASVQARRAASEPPVRQEGPSPSDGPAFGPTAR